MMTQEMPRWFEVEPSWYKDVMKQWKGTASTMPD
jgi:hypothetical protein